MPYKECILFSKEKAFGFLKMLSLFYNKDEFYYETELDHLGILIEESYVPAGCEEILIVKSAGTHEVKEDWY